MVQLSDEQLNNLSKEALAILVSSLQNQLATMKDQLDTANAQLMDRSKQLEIFAEQLRIMNQRQFGKRSEAASEIDG